MHSYIIPIWLLTWRYDKSSVARNTNIYNKYFLGPKDVRAIGVRLYSVFPKTTFTAFICPINRKPILFGCVNEEIDNSVSFSNLNLDRQIRRFTEIGD